MRRRTAFTAAVLAAAAGCVLPQPAPGPGPQPYRDACQRAASNLTELGCPAAQGSAGPDGLRGTDDDETLVERCESLAADRLIDPECWATTTTCNGCSED